jgi:membrane protease YdiL (CAAX protease family)
MKPNMAIERVNARVSSCLRELGLFLLLFFALSVISVPIMYFLLQTLSPFMNLIGLSLAGIELWMALPATLLASFIMTQGIEERPLASIGVRLHSRWWHELLLGVLFGLLLVVAYYAGIIALGLMKLTWSALPLGVIKGLFSIMFFKFLAAFGEEMLFRAYPLQVLITGLGSFPAVLLTSVIFSLSHPYVYQAPLAGVNVMLIGILLAVAYLKTKSLWFPIGLHTGINYFLEVFSQFMGDNSLSGPDYFLGERIDGNYQFVGAPLTVGLLLMSTVLLFLTPIKPHPSMRALWDEYIHPAPFPPWRKRTGPTRQNSDNQPQVDLSLQHPNKHQDLKDV